MSTPPPGSICCRRCEQWKAPSEFYRDGNPLPETRVICRDCYAAWLDEE